MSKVLLAIGVGIILLSFFDILPQLRMAGVVIAAIGLYMGSR